jgi:hypothetical protein
VRQQGECNRRCRRGLSGRARVLLGLQLGALVR